MKDRTMTQAACSAQDYLVAMTLLDFWTGNLSSRERDRRAVATAAQHAFGFDLPHDVYGDTQVQAVPSGQGLWQLTISHGLTSAVLAEFASEHEAAQLQARLQQVIATARSLFEGEIVP